MIIKKLFGSSVYLVSLFFVVNCNIFASLSSTTDLDPTKVLNQLEGPENYYEWADSADESSQIVVLAMPELDTSLNVQSHSAPFKNWHKFFSVAYVHQVHTQRPLVIPQNGPISDVEARNFLTESAAISYHVVKHFKDQGKSVYVLSNFTGAIIYLNAIKFYGNIADKVILGNIRLQYPELFINAFKNGCGALFDRDGVSVTTVNCSQISQNLPSHVSINYFKSILKMKGFGMDSDYTHSLAGIDLSNIMLYSDSRNPATGSLTRKEKSFALTKDFVILSPQVTPGANLANPSLPLPPNSRESAVSFFSLPKLTGDTLSYPPNVHGADYDSREPLLAYRKSGPSVDKYDIGIVFEGLNAEGITQKIQGVFGNGPFSLFKTNVFKNHKNRFNIYYGAIDKIPETNRIFPENISVSKFNSYVDTLGKFIIGNISTLENLDHLQSLFVNFLQVNSISLDPFFYADILRKKRVTDSIAVWKYTGPTEISPEETKIINQIDRNLQKFHDVFDSSSQSLDLKIIVTQGMVGGYADKENNTIYISGLDSFLGTPHPAGSIQEDFFATLLTHEFGHIFGNLADEYYSYGFNQNPKDKLGNLQVNFPDSSDIGNGKFNNNCFYVDYPLTSIDELNGNYDVLFYNYVYNSGEGYEYASLPFGAVFSYWRNPWTHSSQVPIVYDNKKSISLMPGFIPSYNGHLYAGCNGGNSLRGTANSIMNMYFRFRQSNWQEAWGPINSFYLKRKLNSYR